MTGPRERSPNAALPRFAFPRAALADLETAADEFMSRALDLAERGRRTVSPNPMVGCVLVKDGRIVGEGWHKRAGGPHAEIVALADAGDHAAGSTVYVTLEPCNHTGRTGPCSTALADAGVAEVEIALADPNPTAMGGSAALRRAGISVRTGRGAERARTQNRIFLHALAHGRPFVILKAATSLDGRIAAADGTSQWLTGAAARAHVHDLRADVDAIVVGSGTVVVDNPQLTARPAGGTAGQPVRVVLDGQGRTPAGARVLDDAAPTLIVTTEEGRTQLPDHVDTLIVPSGSGGHGVDLTAVLEGLMVRDVRSVLVEGGARVATAFLDAHLVDRFDVHLAPVLLGDGGRPLFTGGPQTLADAERFTLETVDRRGDDVLVSLSRRTPSDGAIQEPATV